MPNPSNRDPWQGQSQECSALFHTSAHPRCGHRFSENVIKCAAAARQLTISCGFNIFLDGEKTGAYGFSLSRIISVRIDADTIDAVIPHLLKPAAA